MGALFKVVGLQVAVDQFKDAVKHAKGPQEYWAGSAVEYGAYIEFGTTRMPARPHWSTGIRLVSMKYGLGADSTAAVNDMISAPRGLVKKIAFDIERHVKKEIRAVGAIDTGNYRGSVTTGPTEDSTLAKSEGLRTDQ